MAFNRVIVLVDMDCFYVQVEQRRDPDKKGKPCAVVQYKKYRGGGIIAVGYEARAKGVTRMMMGNDAKEQCPDIHLFRVPELNGKANLDRYREAGAEVIAVLSQFGGCVERASIDEAYIDLTDVINKILSQNKEAEFFVPGRLPSTHVIGWPQEPKEGEDKTVAREEGVNNWVQGLISGKCSIEDKRLAIAAVMTEEIRAAVYHQTGFRCSAGVSHNKMLSKLVCGINKPNQQTILPKTSISKLFENMKIGKVRNLGGKLGKSLVEDFDIEFMGQIDGIPYDKLERAYGSKSAYWLKEVCHGIDNEPVKERHLAQSIGCGKNFLGPDMLNTKTKMHRWMDALLIELSERLEKDKSANARVARSLTVHLRQDTGKSLSRSGPLVKYDRKDLFQQCLLLIRSLDTASSKDERWIPAITQLNVSAKKFDALGASILLHTSPTKTKRSSTVSREWNLTVKNEQSASSNSKPNKDSGFMANSGTQCPFFKENKDAKSRRTTGEHKFHERSFQGNDKMILESKDSCEILNPKPHEEDKSHRATDGDAFDIKHKDIPEFSETSEPKPFKEYKDIFCESLNVKYNEATEGCPAMKFQERDGVTILPTDELDTPPTKDNDVIFVGVREPKSFFHPTKQNSKKSAVCKIDAMFLKENAKRKSQESDLSDSKVLHPLYGEIDKDVLKDLPPEIQQEITNSYKITTSVLPSSQESSPFEKPPKSTCNDDKNQRLISNFLSSQTASKKVHSSALNLKAKRKMPNPSPLRRKRAKTAALSAKKSLAFKSQPQEDVVPLGFFRQRSQLTSAISKALTREPSKFRE